MNKAERECDYFIMCWKINDKVYGQSEVYPYHYAKYFAGIHTIIYIKRKLNQ